MGKNEYQILSIEKSIRKDRAKGIVTAVFSTLLASSLFGISLKEGYNNNYYESIATLLGAVCIISGGSIRAAQYGERIKKNKQQLKRLMR